MSEFVAIGYTDKYKADEVLLSLLQQEQDHLIDLEDAVTAIADESGSIRVRPYHDLVKPGDLSNELWGGLLSSIVFHRTIEIVDDPLAEVIDDSFLDAAQAFLKPNSSVLFVILRRVDPAKALASLEETGGTILRTAIADEHLS